LSVGILSPILEANNRPVQRAEQAVVVRRDGGVALSTEPTTGQSAASTFANASEAEFARILDFYGLRWEYEPRSFVLQWDEQGRATERFTPDFYLPDFDLYVELTTLRQELVTRKNRKVRRLRELYPGIRVKVFYGRDFRSLLRKYGLPGPAPEPR
jgi:hypothetical protein